MTSLTWLKLAGSRNEIFSANFSLLLGIGLIGTVRVAKLLLLLLLLLLWLIDRVRVAKLLLLLLLLNFWLMIGFRVAKY